MNKRNRVEESEEESEDESGEESQEESADESEPRPRQTRGGRGGTRGR